MVVVITAQLLLLGTMVVAHANLSGTYGGWRSHVRIFLPPPLSSSSSFLRMMRFPLFSACTYAPHLSYASLRRDDGAQHCARNSPNFFTNLRHHVRLFKRSRTICKTVEFFISLADPSPPDFGGDESWLFSSLSLSEAKQPCRTEKRKRRKGREGRCKAGCGACGGSRRM